MSKRIEIRNPSYYEAFSGLLPFAILIVIATLAIATNASAMEFDEYLDGYSMTGEIVVGDAEKFRLFLVNNKSDWSSSPPRIYLFSDGGNVWEAMQMAKFLRAMHATTVVLDGPKSRCASACFFLYLAGIERLALRSNAIGVHRPYIDPKIFGNLTTSKASAAYASLIKNIDSFLTDNQVPLYLIEKINRTSSKEVVWLTDKEVDDIGVYPHWYEELLIAKCGFNKESERRHYLQSNPTVAEKKTFDAYFSRVSNCKQKIFTSDLQKINQLLGNPITPLIKVEKQRQKL